MIRRMWAFLCRVILLMALGIFTINAVIVGLTFPWFGAVALAGAAWRKTRRGFHVSGNFGTARLANLADVIRGKCLCDSGWIMGRLGFVAPPTRRQAIRSLLSPTVKSEMACRQFVAAFRGSRWRGDGFIRISDGIHAATFAPAAGGKSVSVLVPNLLSHPGNCVVVDPKGELFSLTAEHRRKKFGHKIVRLDPALLCGPGANGFNVFDWIDPRASDFIDICRDLANMLVVSTGKELDPHWNDSAENVIAAFIAYVCACEGVPECRNLRGMRTLIASRQNFGFALEAMQKNEDFFKVLQQLGYQLAWHVDRELGSVMTHAQRHTNIFDSPLVVDSTSITDWDPAELRTGRMTVYLVVPADKLVVWAGLQRLWLGCILRIITRGVPTEKNPVLFLVDEAAHIGRMQALEDGITLMRGMGIRLWLFFQSLDQLNKCFGDHAATVLDNLATQQFFAINSYETAEAISKRIGDETVIVRTDGGNSGTSWSTGVKSDGGSRNTGTSVTTSETSRRLFKPEEILTLHESVGIVFHKNNPVILCQLIKYYSDKAFRRGGTGRTRGLGLGEMVLALTLLALSGICTALVARLQVPVRQRPPAVAPGEFFNNGAAGIAGDEFGDTVPMSSPDESWQEPPSFQPAPYRPGRRRQGRRPLTYRRGQRHDSPLPDGSGIEIE
jgi:type IV secretion system protein VirD4